MKIRILILVAAVAAVTLSFTFANVGAKSSPSEVNATTVTVNQPLGGFALEESL